MTLSVFSALASTLTGPLGEPVEWTPEGGEVKTVSGIVSIVTELDVMSEGRRVVRMAGVSLSDAEVSGISTGDHLRVRGANYRVEVLLPDGEGMIDVHLERAP